MMVRHAYMEDKTTYEVPADGLLGCFERGYVFGVGPLGGQYVLNVSHILYFGPRREARWLKEVSE